MKADPGIKLLTEEAQEQKKKVERAVESIKRVVVGQEDIINKVMAAIIADGHVLLEGVPGLAKTLLIKTLSGTMHSTFQRIQFTPDLLPADIIGTKIYNHTKGTFSTQKGPIFANVILADEINRAPPKVQSALLEAMQEYQVTISGETHAITRPFLVLATQNPIETEGTYLLPEAQVDRFMMKLIITYPSKEEEIEIMRRMTGNEVPSAEAVLEQKDILALQGLCRRIYADPAICDYVARIVDCTRHPEAYGLDINGHIDYGASPRASIWLILAGKARALMEGRGYVTPDDIKTMAHDVLRHRILLSFEAEAEGVTPDDIITKIIKTVKSP